MHNSTVQQSLTTVSPNSNPTIVMLQAETGLVSKHNVILSRCPCPPFIAPMVAQMPMVSCQGIEAFTTGSPHTNTIVITAEIKYGFVAKYELVSFRCNPVSSCVEPFQTEASMGAQIQNVLQSGDFVWFERTQGPLLKVLPKPGWRPMKQLAVLVHFLLCGGLIEDWSVGAWFSCKGHLSDPLVPAPPHNTIRVA
ncbi:uncharacterized protein TNCV_98191 [Trichonephila clavipes]|nr:uncharacterized protein TNCV_98191 [Trichonephila clavipes]